MKNNKSIILLSGGLDSLVCLGLCKEDYNIELAITFNYSQKSAEKEINAAKNLCRYYNIKSHEIIGLNWLADITNTAIVSDEKLPDNIDNPAESAKAVWVPNRNGLFLNIAAAYADSYEYTHIILGANKEEAATFPDNSQFFINAINKEFEYSTMNKPKLIAPLINYNKNDIVCLALKNNMPLELVQSCYSDHPGHCGACESCIRLRQALEYNNAKEYIKNIFND